MIQTSYNPDVLSCLANLSNDEVFTPPGLVNQILDLLPKEIWENTDAKFLDPVSKSGVFLREIAKRLIIGLEKQIPDNQKRINHIYTNQLYGIAITELTSLLSRRSVYCSKTANGKYSVCDDFKNEQGNIIYERMQHSWENGKCEFCGASQEVYDREDALETYAYPFIHTDITKKIFKNMKFDVIVGNPPYQLSDAGFGRSSSPIYHLFVEQAKKLNPRYLTMIIPARWYASGKGLDNFRKNMLNDNRIRILVDYSDASEVFPGVDIAGGICYFLWERDNAGLCKVRNIHKGIEQETVRSLNEFETFIRDGNALPIINKVLAKDEKSMSTIVSSRKPFGLSTTIRPLKKGDITLVWTGGDGPFESSKVDVGQEMIGKYKVITSYVSYDHGGQPGPDGKRKVLSKIQILPPNTICTESYLVIGSFVIEKEAVHLKQYLSTLFVRFLIAQLALSQHVTKDRYLFVPIQDFTQPWTDEMLFAKYDLNNIEVDKIKNTIKPMNN
jgi:site-specific DNA-methyltransferase (adenine-specific)